MSKLGAVDASFREESVLGTFLVNFSSDFLVHFFGIFFLDLAEIRLSGGANQQARGR